MKLRTFKILAVICLFTMFASGAFATTTSGTVTVTKSAVINGFQSIFIDMTSDSSGNVVSTDPVITGQIVSVAFNPGGTAPSDNWDVVLADQDAQDVLLGFGSNHDTANTEVIHFIGANDSFATGTLSNTVNTLVVFYPWVMNTHGRHTITVTNAGDNKTLSLRILVKVN